MRIIAGKHKSRLLVTLEGMNTRPMTDRMKESVFNCIGPYFDSISVLDLFGGSGALSLEAISRGAAHSYIIDNSKEAIKIIRQNVTSLKEEASCSVYQSDYKIALNKLKNEKFDLVFLDPPYRLNIIKEILDFILENDMLNDGANLVCQFVRGNLEKLGVDENYHKDELKVIKNYSHGNSEMLIYEFSKN